LGRKEEEARTNEEGKEGRLIHKLCLKFKIKNIISSIFRVVRYQKEIFYGNETTKKKKFKKEK
jgi:hypothetical protein